MPKCDNEKTKDREGGDNGETIVIEENKVVSEDKEAPETFRSSRPEVFLRKDVFKICSKFAGEHPCQSVISVKLQSNFIEIALRHGCSPVREIVNWLKKRRSRFYFILNTLRETGNDSRFSFNHHLCVVLIPFV